MSDEPRGKCVYKELDYLHQSGYLEQHTQMLCIKGVPDLPIDEGLQKRWLRIRVRSRQKDPFEK